MSYDVIIVGGGLGGAALAINLARRGRKVLVFERETRFKDRVRGEQMHPWGVTAARELGIYDHLKAACGHQTRWWISYFGGAPVAKRDLEETTPHRAGSFNFYHPDMQESLLRLAEESGAEILRGITVDSVEPGDPPSANFQDEGGRKTLQARIVVCADGRNSRGRTWGGFKVNRDPDRLTIAGALLEGTLAPDDAVHMAMRMEGVMLMAPLGNKRARTYFIYRKSDGNRSLSGKEQVPEFLSLCRGTGVSPEWFETAQVAGPLAQFDGADHWVAHPARDGVALIGDAAAATDPSWGSGLSLTLLDVRNFVNCLSATENWSEALDEYARKHDEYYGTLHRIENWVAEFVWSEGAEAEARRARVMPRLLSNPAGAPDIIGLGPESPSGEAARRILFGED